MSLDVVDSFLPSDEKAALDALAALIEHGELPLRRQMRWPALIMDT